MKIYFIRLFSLSLMFAGCVFNARPDSMAGNGWTPDNGDGTFTNPLMWGDWPDPDVTRVGDDFYFVSTSMHYVPGCPIATSKDLVNWTMAGYAVPRYDEDPRYDMKGGSLYLNGSWASTIRYHNGLFYVGFCTPYGQGTDKGHFSICTATNVSGPWTRTIFPEYLYDPGLLFDDDGKVYVAHGQGTLYVTELNADAQSVKTPRKEVFPNNPHYPYLEGSHFYKINGKYYILGSTGGTGGREVCLRSDNVYGPYETKVVINDKSTYPPNGLHQGGMVQLKDGTWWFIIMQDRGPIGRTPNLELVTWVDGWPMLGKDGKGVVTFKKPNVGGNFPVAIPATSDEFNSPALGLQWQWNHNPDNANWSLTEHPGSLCLHADKASDLKHARNTLTQRVQGPTSEGTVEMDVRGLRDGDVAGFGIFQLPYAYVAVQQDGDARKIVMVNDNKVIATVDNFTGDTVWFRASATVTGYAASFFYSTDNKTFQPIGNELKMALGLNWTANRFALFNFSTTDAGVGGHADFNWFHYTTNCTPKPAVTVGATKQFPRPGRIRYDGHCLTIDGQDTFIYSAAFHYFRVPRELWRDRFQKIKDAGFNTVETYVPWNWHERDLPAGLDDFSKVDLSEIADWLKMAQDEFGLYTIVRPGPFICAEWAGGGYPRWLAKFAPSTGPDFWLRSADDEYIAWSGHWYAAACKLFASEQLTRKPKGGKGIILVQIENEYDHHECADKSKLLRALFDDTRKAGVEVPIFTCLTGECRESKDPILSQVFDCDNYYVGLTEAPGCAQRMASLRAHQPDAPGFVTELQGGWFSLVGGRLSEDNYSDARHYNAISLMSLLGGATGLNTYMFVGGTHFGGWGARGQTTSYDYNAPIRESGARGPKYTVAESIGEFLRKNQTQLLRAEGGPCELQGAPTNLFGGVRVGPDGTRFVFLDNTNPKNPISGKVTVLPGKITKPAGPIYNLDQNGNRVLIKADTATVETNVIAPFDVDYELAALGAKVLVIPPGKTAAEGIWYPKPQSPIARPATLPASVRLASALKRNDPLDGPWQPLPVGKSLPELGVSDQRYVLYRAQVPLAAGDTTNFTKLLINSFSRDLVFAQVNGKLATRLYPSDAYAAAATRNTDKSFARIKPDEFDNRFDLAGLLSAGTNEIVLLYENIGYEHGYFPMEELSGVRQAGLSDTEKAIIKPLDWQVATNLGGVANGWMRPEIETRGWEKVALETNSPVPRKGNHIQPKSQPDALFTWYRLEFELPSLPANTWIPWRLLLNASGNGFMWLNGHDIGRHWELGPQREFFLPECWLNFGPGKKNILVLGLSQTLNGAKLNAAEILPYPDSAEIRNLLR